MTAGERVSVARDVVAMLGIFIVVWVIMAHFYGVQNKPIATIKAATQEAKEFLVPVAVNTGRTEENKEVSHISDQKPITNVVVKVSCKKLAFNVKN